MLNRNIFLLLTFCVCGLLGCDIPMKEKEKNTYCICRATLEMIAVSDSSSEQGNDNSKVTSKK